MNNLHEYMKTIARLNESSEVGSASIIERLDSALVKLEKQKELFSTLKRYYSEYEQYEPMSDHSIDFFNSHKSAITATIGKPRTNQLFDSVVNSELVSKANNQLDVVGIISLLQQKIDSCDILIAKIECDGRDILDNSSTEIRTEPAIEADPKYVAMLIKKFKTGLKQYVSPSYTRELETIAKLNTRIVDVALSGFDANDKQIIKSELYK